MMASQLLEQTYQRIDDKQRGKASFHYGNLENLQWQAKQLQEIIIKGDRPLTKDEQTLYCHS